MNQIIIYFLLFINIFAYASGPQYYCTASDAGYFDCLKNLIGGIHKYNFDQLGEILVFDLGLSESQREWLSHVDKLKIYEIERLHPDTLKPFNTRVWGKPVPGWYAWKAIAIKQALDIYDQILWIDAGTTVYKPLDDLFEYITYTGYFFHNGSSWSLKQACTEYAIEKLRLYSPERQWMLDHNTKGLESGLMGITRKIAPYFVLPMYNLAKDLRNFVDDGTAGRGFGDYRPDQTLFSIYALLHKFYIFHHYERPLDRFKLKVGDNKYAMFHIACNSEDRIENTHIYCSRFDLDFRIVSDFIRFKESEKC